MDAERKQLLQTIFGKPWEEITQEQLELVERIGALKPTATHAEASKGTPNDDEAAIEERRRKHRNKKNYENIAHCKTILNE